MQTDPKFTDGRTAILDPILENLNVAGSGTTYQRYEYLSDSIDRDAVEKEHTDADGSPLGSDTREGFTKGSINLQLTLASDTIARPGHIIHLNTGGHSKKSAAGKTAQLEIQLFNLSEDAAESKNVAAAHPELVVELQKDMAGAYRPPAN